MYREGDAVSASRLVAVDDDSESIDEGTSRPNDGNTLGSDSLGGVLISELCCDLLWTHKHKRGYANEIHRFSPIFKVGAHQRFSWQRCLAKLA